MRWLWMLSLILPAATFVSCNKCKNPDFKEQAPLIDEYFGNYKPGAYWIFLNRDSTKRDSMWVDQYKISDISERQFSCVSGRETEFIVHSSYLALNEATEVLISMGGRDFDVTYIYGDFISLEATKDSKEFSMPGYEIPVLDSFKLWQQDSINYYQVINYGSTRKIAPHIGIIQYVSYKNSNDTFSLIKYSMP